MERVPFDSNELTAELKRRAEVELNELESTRDGKIEEMRVLLRAKNLKLPEDDSFFLKFLRARKFDVPKAVKLCENCFRLQKTKLYQSTDYLSLVDKLQDFKKFGILPYRDPSGCPILFYRIEKWDPDKIPLTEFIQGIYLLYMIGSFSPVSQVAGFKVIADCGGLSLRQLIALNPRKLHRFIETVENALPGRYKEVHFLNQSKIFDCFWAIVKPFMREKLRSRCFLHGSNFEELHKHIPPEILPAECGGHLGEYDNAYFAQYFSKAKAHIDDMKQYGY